VRALRVLLVDDNEAFRALVAAFLQDLAPVVEQATDGDMAVRMARELRPDIVVMDISMPRLDGISAARAIQASVPSARIIFLSGTETGQKLREAAVYGAVIEKDVTDLHAELRAALQRAA
jgi:two-component system, chemotaxis family, protein-glutamate methylesterase/glutaminase